MAEIMRMPEVLAGASEASIQAWLVTPGTTLVIDQPIAEVETEKATVELTAEFAGALGRILVAEGDNVAVGDPIAVLLGEGEGDADIEAALTGAGLTTDNDQPAAASADASASAPQPTDDAVTANGHATTGPGERRFISPIVRRLARQQGVDLNSLNGTGPNGRVVRRDLEQHLTNISRTPQPASPAPGEDTEPPVQKTVESPKTPQPQPSSQFEDLPVDRMRKAIARRLTESKTTVPHFYLVADCRVDALIDLRRKVNEAASRKASINDFVLKAVAGALAEVPEANSIWLGDAIRRYTSVDISVAVATDGGLTTPVLRGVDRMPLSAVSATVADLAERARAGRLRQHELEGGSFSVSNLGMFGTTKFSAILNPPQSGILAVGAARQTAVVNASGELAVGAVMTVTLSADHRVLDGAVAAQWLAAFQRRIENPLSILI